MTSLGQIFSQINKLKYLLHIKGTDKSHLDKRNAMQQNRLIPYKFD